MAGSNSGSSPQEMTPPTTPPLAPAFSLRSVSMTHTSKRSFSESRQGSLTPPRPLDITVARPDMSSTHQVVSGPNGVSVVVPECEGAPPIGEAPIYMTPRPEELGGNRKNSMRIAPPWYPPGDNFDALIGTIDALEEEMAVDEPSSSSRSSPREHMRGMKRAARPPSPSPMPRPSQRRRTDPGPHNDNNEVIDTAELRRFVGTLPALISASSKAAYPDEHALATSDLTAGPSRPTFAYTNYDWEGSSRVVTWTAAVSTTNPTHHEAPPTPLGARITGGATVPNALVTEPGMARFHGLYADRLRAFTYPIFPALPSCNQSQVSDVAVFRGGPCSVGCNEICDKGSSRDADATPCGSEYDLDTYHCTSPPQAILNASPFQATPKASYCPPQPGEIRTPTTPRLAHAPAWVRRAWRAHDMVEEDVEIRRRHHKVEDDEFEADRQQAQLAGEPLPPDLMLEHFWRQAARAAEMKFATVFHDLIVEHTRGFL